MKFPGKIPISVDPITRQFLNDLVIYMDRQISQTVFKTEPLTELLLQSPNGNVYALRVDDTGTLSATLVAS